MSLVIVNPYITVAPTYSFSAPATASKYEGESITYTVATTGFVGTLYWTIESVTGTVSNADFSSPANAVTAGGSVAITNGTGSFTLTLATDALTETESYRVRLRINSTSGEIVATSNTITILDSPTGEAVYTTAGTYTWVAPAGVYSVSAVAVGGGGGGSRGTATAASAGGGGLGWKNSIAVTPGVGYTVVVGAAGSGDTLSSFSTTDATDGGTSYFISTGTVSGGGGAKGPVPTANSSGGGYTGDGGGSGGGGKTSGAAGGAGGYSGNGGAGSNTMSTAGGAGAGGGGGGGGVGSVTSTPGAGGGVGLYGAGSNGAGGTAGGTNIPGGGGGGGSGGSDGGGGQTGGVGGAAGGSYGGGGASSGWNGNSGSAGSGGGGAVRIIYGSGRSFPNNAA